MIDQITEGYDLPALKAAAYQYMVNGVTLKDHQFREVLQAVPNPILVDFNGVITNNEPWEGYIPNPAAQYLIKNLQESGTVIVTSQALLPATIYTDAEKIILPGIEMLNRLDEWRLGDCMVMTGNTFDFMEEQGRKENIIERNMRWDEYFERLNDLVSSSQSEDERQRLQDFIQQVTCTKKESESSGWLNKSLAPIFQKPYLIPLIDDTWGSTDYNPGIRGFHVPAFQNYTAEPLARMVNRIESEGQDTFWQWALQQRDFSETWEQRCSRELMESYLVTLATIGTEIYPPQSNSV